MKPQTLNDIIRAIRDQAPVSLPPVGGAKDLVTGTPFDLGCAGKYDKGYRWLMTLSLPDNKLVRVEFFETPLSVK